MKRPAAVALTVLAVALGAAGCGGSDSAGDGATPTGEWANGFCSALTTWTSSIQSLSSTLDDSGLSKESLQTALDDASSATKTLADDLDALGKPDTSSGGEVQDSLDRLSTGLQAEITEIEQATEDVTGVSDLIKALPTIGSSLSAMGTLVQTMLTELNEIDAKGELEDALNQADACADLTK